ncbi:MAG: type IV pilus secretin PilQ [bacterium]
MFGDIGMKGQLSGFTAALATVLLGWMFAANLYAAPTKLENIGFASLPGGEFEIKMDFSGTPPEPVGYSTDSPARIVLDLEGVESVLAEKKYALSFDNAKSAVVVSAGDKTRLVVNLNSSASFETSASGNSLMVTVGGSSSVSSSSAGYAASSSFVGNDLSASSGGIASIDFDRGEAGEGIVTLELENPQVNVDVDQKGSDIIVQFYQTALPEQLNRRLDVMDFATPIKQVDATYDGSTTRVAIDATGEFEYSAFQADTRYVISVRPLSPREVEQRLSQFQFVGEKLSLNFQDIEVRSVLQLIADFTDLNLVASDTVQGNITLRLENVPWDQALDIVLKAKGLDKRQNGNVLMVAPAAEIAEQERLQVEANKQLEELAPLRTEFLRIRYADARELFELFDADEDSSGGVDNGNATKSILSERGSAIVDDRTNTIILTDTEEKIAEFKRLIEEIDIPVEQVLIEARIVIANTDFRKELGVRWGAQGRRNPGDDLFGFGGNLEHFESPTNPIEAFDPVEPGTILVNENALNVDLGVPNAAGSIAFELLTDNTFIDLELSALEEDGGGEIVSQPKILTGDKQTAYIKAGTEIAYQEATSSGATNVEFKEAVLRLEVTPQITPDNRVIMDLLVSQDSVGDLVVGGEPSIDVTELKTKTLVADGQTLVLGGIFQIDKQNGVEKVPFFGDIPIVGNLFKNKIRSEEKREILIFITPKIVHDSLID